MAQPLARADVAGSNPDPSTWSTATFDTEPFFRFGSIEVDMRRRLVTADGENVKIGGRAFDLLAALLQTRGTVVDKRHLMNQVWPCTTVDESNLRFQMTCLRRALGSSCEVIKTIPGRGYFFVAETVSVERAERRVLPVDLHRRAESNRDFDMAVAIVEDDEGVREALDGLLRSFGFSVEAYACPTDFFQAGPRTSGCVILDVWLPGRSGLEVQADLNAAGSDVPLIFISGHADVHMSVKAMKAGAFEFLTKPIRHEEVIQAVRNALLIDRPRSKSAK